MPNLKHPNPPDKPPEKIPQSPAQQQATQCKADTPGSKRKPSRNNGTADTTSPSQKSPDSKVPRKLTATSTDQKGSAKASKAGKKQSTINASFAAAATVSPVRKPKTNKFKEEWAALTKAPDANDETAVPVTIEAEAEEPAAQSATQIQKPTPIKKSDTWEKSSRSAINQHTPPEQLIPKNLPAPQSQSSSLKQTAPPTIPGTPSQSMPQPPDVPNQSLPVSLAMSNQLKVFPKSALRKSFAAVAREAAKLPPPLLPQWKAHRFATTFEIKMPKDRSKRTEYIALELNKLLQTIAINTKVYVRQYKEHHTPRGADRSTWIKQFSKEKTSELTMFTHGFYIYQALRDGVFRLQIQLIVPISTDIAALMIDVNGHKWASKKSRSIRDIRDQNLFNPKYLGWLFRSNYSMVNSTELQQEFETMASKQGLKISFGLTFKSIPNSNPGQTYNKDTAIKAVCVSTNSDNQTQAWDILMQWYNSKTPTYPLGIPLMFVPAKDHPDIRNNPVAAQNVSTITDRQRIFLRDTDSAPCPHLADPSMLLPNSKSSLRDKLLEITAKVSPEDYNGGKLFHAITKKTSPDGDTSYHITYHNCVGKEARSIIGGMGQFLRVEMKLDPDDYCHAHLLKDTHDWDIATRSATNTTTDYLSFLVETTKGDDDDSKGSVQVDESDEFSMDSKGKRESKRVIGLDDAETVNKTLKEKKQRKKKKSPVPAEIADSQSVTSDLTNDTKYSSQSKASAHRKELRSKVNEQEIALDEKDDEIANREAEILRLRTAMEQMLKQKVTATQVKSEVTNPQDKSAQSSGEEGSNESQQSQQSAQEDTFMIDASAHPEVEEVPPPKGYVKDVPNPNFVDALFRGPAQQIQAVAAAYREQGRNIQIIESVREGYYEIYAVDDPSEPEELPKQNLRFDPYKQVKEFDPESTEVQSDADDVSMEEVAETGQSSSSASDTTSSSKSSSSSSSESSSGSKESKASSKSDSLTTPTKQKKTKPNKARVSNITQNNMAEAKLKADILSNTNGGGPKSDV